MFRPLSALCQQRKLFLLVFVWTLACILVLKSSLLSGGSRPADQPPVIMQERAAESSWLDYQEYPLAGSSSAAPVSPSPVVPPTVKAPATSGSRAHSQAAFPGADCAYKFPALFDLQFNEVYWQRLTVRWAAPANQTDATLPGNQPAQFYLYNAYYDNRWRGGLPSVRLLAMIDRVAPPATNCLFWSKPTGANGRHEPPIVAPASYVYAWYPKWGNYKDGILQPWLVTCHLPKQQQHVIPDSVSLVEAAPRVLGRRKRSQDSVSMAMPAAFSSSSSSSASPAGATTRAAPKSSPNAEPVAYDCDKVKLASNNLKVINRRPETKKRFAVCVKGLDFPKEDVSVRLVEWIEMLHLLGADKIFLYSLNVHDNISRVLHYYQRRGMVELMPLTLPGDQPNLPELQHLYLKNKLTAKRQNELIPYNDCLYRNLYSYQYLALLDIDEVIMPLKARTWFELMDDVEQLSLGEQNYSRASYNVRNVYFFDDLAGPMGLKSTVSQVASELQDLSNEDADSEANTERGIPPYLHMMQHVYRSKNYTKPGQYVKCFHNTDRVVSLHNHYPMNCFGQCTSFSIPVTHAHLQHYRKDCVGPLKQSCKSDFRVFTQRDTTIWKYKQQMIRRTTRVLNALALLAKPA